MRPWRGLCSTLASPCRYAHCKNRFWTSNAPAEGKSHWQVSADSSSLSFGSLFSLQQRIIYRESQARKQGLSPVLSFAPADL